MIDTHQDSDPFGVIVVVAVIAAVIFFLTMLSMNQPKTPTLTPEETNYSLPTSSDIPYEYEQRYDDEEYYNY